MRIPETRSEELPPMRVNTVTMFLVGTVVWVAALVVVLLLRAAGNDLDGALQICLTGIGIGLLALLWAVPHERRAARRRQTSGGTRGTDSVR
ncbi:DUF2530 domain-containing protein [uncultured Georgenia sp.]|uniref:DUF2530 domain-containing protein n=1 Tax=uncultured Georgenia sp. TaxID=378209 RepID=UPI002625097E|nr:DUF2530 domain-containing protein [uncultured Georgenia sp.]HLV03357.1 DUF2530 domain-containing protein [Actinomycetaceae bacterium]